MPRSVAPFDGKIRGLQDGLRSVPSRVLGFDQGRGSSYNPGTVPFRFEYLSAGTFDFTPDRSGFYDCYGFGRGGTGGTSAGSTASDGGGGGAGFIRLFLKLGDVLTWVIGSTVTLSLNGVLVASIPTAGNGAAGARPGGLGGVPVGWTTNRVGGQGSGETNPDGDPNTSDGVPTGSAGDGNPTGNNGSGAGFTDGGILMTGGHGGTGGTSGAPGAAGVAGKALIVGPR